MKKFIYQDPRRPRVKSRPIDESDVQSRQVLEGGGWKIVETLDDAAPAVSVEGAAPGAPAADQGDDAVSAAARKARRSKRKSAPATPEA